MSAQDFDFSEPAELYCGRGRGVRTTAVSYRRFDAAAEAIRYAVDELSSANRRACVLEVNENRYDHLQIRKLYDSSGYPLPRRSGKDEDAP